MHKHSLVVLLASSLIFIGSSASAQDSQYLEHGFQMAMVDFNEAHHALIEACTKKYPNSATNLEKATEEWQAKNSAAQQELQKIYIKKAGLSKQQGDARFKQATDGFEWSMLHLPAKEFESACKGEYARVSLHLPELDFNKLLENVRASSDFK